MLKIDIASHRLPSGKITYGYFWLVFPEGTGDQQLYVSTNDPHNNHNGHVRLSKDGNQYGQPGLTEDGRSTLELLVADSFEVFSDEPDSRIRVQLADNFAGVTEKDLKSFIDDTMLRLGDVFGPITWGQHDPIS